MIQFMAFPPDGEDEDWRLIIRAPKRLCQEQGRLLNVAFERFHAKESFTEEVFDAFGANETDFFYGFALEYNPSGNLADYLVSSGLIQAYDETSFFEGLQRWQ